MKDLMTGILALIVITALAFYAGRYTAGNRTETKTEDTSKSTTTQHETITETKKKDGTNTTVTVIDTVSQSTDKKETVSKQTVQTNKPRLNVSALIASTIHNPIVPSYGLSINKEFIGPITIGAFGLTNGTIGLSIGLNFSE